MKRLWNILTLIILTGCGPGNYDFETVATYQADNSNLQVNLTATGHVPAGADLGEGKVNGTITSTKFADTIYFQINSTELTLLIYKQEEIEISDPKDFSKTLMDYLDEIGYINYDIQEIIELGKIIIATTYGPKGTYIDGQTDLVKVINVDFKRE